MTPTLMTFIDNPPLLLPLPSPLKALHDTPDTNEDASSFNPATGLEVEGMCDSLESDCLSALVRAIPGVKKALLPVTSKRLKTMLPAAAMPPLYERNSSLLQAAVWYGYMSTHAQAIRQPISMIYETPFWFRVF